MVLAPGEALTFRFQLRYVCLGGEARGVGSRRGAHLPVLRHRQVPLGGTQAGVRTRH